MISINKGKIPFFSVIMCTYNRSKIIKRAINSLLNQTEKDWELIIVDDGSTDETFKMIMGYLNNYNNIRYLYHSHRGLPQSRNAGILAASGLFITFLDTDDEYEPNHLELRRKVLISHPDVDLVYGGLKINGDEYVKDMHNPDILVSVHDCKVGGTFVFKKDLAVELGGFDNHSYADDAYFFYKAMEAGWSIGKIDSPTYHYHRDSASTITSEFKRNNQE